MQRHPAFYIVLLCTAWLAGCGFQLRGTGLVELPGDWQSMYLVTNNPNSEFSREVKARFAANGVQWQESRADANYLVTLGGERFNQRNLSLNSEARAAEFELTMVSTFSVRGADGKQVMPNTTATVLKQMENDPQNPVGKTEEIRILKAEMRAELAEQIMRRIAFFAASQDA